MTEATAAPVPRPRHLLVIGILAVLWDSMGAFDYVMTQTRNEAYMSNFTPEQLEFFYNFPSWLVFFWAIAVWGGLAGAVLLLMRKRLAVPVLLTSFVCMVVTAIHNFFIANGLEIMGTGGAIFSAAIFLIALGLWLYARAMAEKGVLV
jgi:hypothetical protein